MYWVGQKFMWLFRECLWKNPSEFFGQSDTWQEVKSCHLWKLSVFLYHLHLPLLWSVHAPPKIGFSQRGLTGVEKVDHSDLLCVVHGQMELWQVCWVSHGQLAQLQFTVPWNCSLSRVERNSWILLRKVRIKMYQFRAPLRRETRGDGPPILRPHSLCCSQPFLHFLGLLVHSAASQRLYHEEPQSISPGQELLGFSSKMPTASQWTKRTHPGLSASLLTLILPTSTSLGAPPVLSHLIPVTGLLPVLVPQIRIHSFLFHLLP